MIYKETPTDWKDLQKKVATIFKDTGYIDVEIEKKIDSVRGKIEVDVYAINDTGISVCECKNWDKKIPQSVVQTFRTIIQEIGANSGYLISKKGFQTGAHASAKSTNILLLDWYEFQSKMEDTWINNVGRYLFKYVDPLFRFTDTIVPRALIDHLSEMDQKYFWELYDNYNSVWLLTHKFYPVINTKTKEEIADFCRSNFAFPLVLDIPMSTKKTYVEDLDGLRNYIIKYTDEGVKKFRNLIGK